MAPPLLLSPVSASPTPVRQLNQHNRERLMRSTRKLGAVLGATPLVVLPRTTPLPPPPDNNNNNSSRSPRSTTRSRSFSESNRPKSRPRSLHRQQSVTTHRRPSVSSSTSSFEIVDIPHDLPPVKLTKSAAASTANYNKPRQVTLYLNTALANSSRSTLHPPYSPSLLNVTAPPSPTHSVISIAPTPAPDVIRRRKMAKLKRTLGENVPVELVFRQTASIVARSNKSSPLSPPASPRPPPPPPPPVPSSVPQLIVTTAPHTTPAFPLLYNRRQAARRPGSAAPFSERLGHANNTTGGGPAAAAQTHAPDWTGEWNVRDIRTVQKELRALRKS